MFLLLLLLLHPKARAVRVAAIALRLPVDGVIATECGIVVCVYDMYVGAFEHAHAENAPKGAHAARARTV